MIVACSCGRHFLSKQDFQKLCNRCRKLATKENRCKTCGKTPLHFHGVCIDCRPAYEQFERSMMKKAAEGGGDYHEPKRRTQEHRENTRETKFGCD